MKQVKLSFCWRMPSSYYKIIFWPCFSKYVHFVPLLTTNFGVAQSLLNIGLSLKSNHHQIKLVQIHFLLCNVFLKSLPHAITTPQCIFTVIESVLNVNTSKIQFNAVNTSWNRIWQLGFKNVVLQKYFECNKDIYLMCDEGPKENKQTI